MHQSHASTDCVIIGAGPIGLEMAVALKHANVGFQHIEAGQIGSTMQWWAPGTRFFSSPERIAIAGVPLTLPHQDKATREEYLSYLRSVAQQFDLQVRTYTRITGIRSVDGRFELALQPSAHGVGGPDELLRPPVANQPTQQAQTMVAQHVILAIGDMHRPRMIDVPGEDLPHVSHYLGDPHTYFGRRVLIVGGKNSAVEAALRLHRAGAHVAVSYRGTQFDPKRVKYWLRPELEWLISKNRIAFHPNTCVAEITRDSVRLAPGPGSPADSHDIEVPADFVLLMTGYVQDATLFEQLGVELQGHEQSPRFDLHTMQTNVPGVYVAGTAAGGSQSRARLFIENSHVHVVRIIRCMAGIDLPWIATDHYAAFEEA